jgi:hypothetical protein
MIQCSPGTVQIASKNTLELVLSPAPDVLLRDAARQAQFSVQVAMATYTMIAVGQKFPLLQDYAF